MTTLQIIKMLVEQAIKEDNSCCDGCKYDKVSVEEYPCCKCRRVRLDYYERAKEEGVNNV